MCIRDRDLYHALERLHALCAGLYGDDSPWATRMAHTWTAMLKNDQVGEVIMAARRRRQDLGPPPQDALEKQIAYFEHHQDKMRYKTYRQQGDVYKRQRPSCSAKAQSETTPIPLTPRCRVPSKSKPVARFD